MNFINKFFELRGHINKKESLFIGIFGFILIMLSWHLISNSSEEMKSFLPTPHSVAYSYVDLYTNGDVINNSYISIYRNLYGYLKAVGYAIPIGFIVGLIPLFKALFSKYIDAMRFIPLTATTGIFIVWFGIGEIVKVNFLAFGIFVYLLPIVVQRVEELEDVYIQTAKTMGASKLQIVLTVFVPGVFGKLFDDIRVMVAISWTYIIIAELINNQGGLGVMINQASRQSRIDKVFALLFLIIFIGIIQDLIFKRFSKIIFPYKYL